MCLWVIDPQPVLVHANGGDIFHLPPAAICVARASGEFSTVGGSEEHSHALSPQLGSHRFTGEQALATDLDASASGSCRHQPDEDY